MPKSPTALAKQLLEADSGELEELRIHEFEDDAKAHDDDATEALYQDFSAEFDRAQAALSKKYGQPSRVGKDNDDAIPLNGVFRFAVWAIEDKQLFLAAAHEDRGVPVILMLGTADGEEA
jgi:hypothetical protein